MRKWEGIRKNVDNMENTMLKLMQNPQTTPEQLSMAAKLYADVSQRLADCAKSVDDYLYHGIKPEPKQSVHMMSCVTTKSGNEDDCNCKDWQQELINDKDTELGLGSTLRNLRGCDCV